MRLLLLVCIIVHPAAVPVSAAVCAGPYSEAGACLPGDGFAADMQLSRPLAVVSAIIRAEFPLVPTFSVAGNAASGDGVNDSVDRTLSGQSVNVTRTSSQARVLAGPVQKAVVPCSGAARCSPSAAAVYPPCGGYPAALLSFLATQCVPAFPSQVICNAPKYNHPAPRVGFFIAEGTRA